MEAVDMCLAVLSLGPVAVPVLFAGGRGMVPVAGSSRRATISRCRGYMCSAFCG
jgi:hypothetical protein